MRFEILNVEHGFAAYAQGSDGSVYLFDCGYSESCRPSELLPARGIQVVRRLFVTNYDEDHIGDLPDLFGAVRIEILSRNTSLTSAQIRSLKTPPITRAMQRLLDMVDEYTGGVTADQLDPPGLQASMFHNSYPTFTDTNNLSLLIFVDVGPTSFAVTGDLERTGWLKLLEDPQVRHHLGRVNVFVASHHGRESGYCREVFDYCSPNVVVMSDGAIQYETQEMAGTYGQHASGISFTTAAGTEIRKVISTRNDGDLFWDI